MEREKSNGAIAYEAAWTVNGATHEAAVLEDGTLLNTEETMTVDKAPAAIQAAVAKHFPGSTKVAVEKLTIVAYEAEGKAWIASGAALNGLAAEIGAQTGQTISLGRAPAGVQAAVARQFPGNPKVDLKKKTLVLYELAGRANGKPAEMLVTSSGNRIEQGDDGESEDDDDEGEDDDDEDDDEDEDDDDGEDDDENGEDD